MRARNIKPGFFENEYLVEFDADTRLLFIGLWLMADREGLMEDKPKKIKFRLFPMNDIDIDACLELLAKHDFILRYEVEGEKFIQVKKFKKHQNPHMNEKASEIPSPGAKSKKTGLADKKNPKWTALRAEILDRDGKKCVKCGVKKDLSIDHIIPKSKGGDVFNPQNLQVLCRSCNSKKNAKMPNNQEDTENSSNYPSTPVITGAIEKLPEHSSNGASTPVITRGVENLPEPSSNDQSAPVITGRLGLNPDIIIQTAARARARVANPMPKNADDTSDLGQQQQFFILLKTAKKGTENLFFVTPEHFRELKDAFPTIDVEQSLRECQEWNANNPEKRQTAKGIKKHITEWIERDLERGKNLLDTPANGRSSIPTRKITCEQCGKGEKEVGIIGDDGLCRGCYGAVDPPDEVKTLLSGFGIPFEGGAPEETERRAELLAQAEALKEGEKPWE